MARSAEYWDQDGDTVTRQRAQVEVVGLKEQKLYSLVVVWGG